MLRSGDPLKGPLKKYAQASSWVLSYKANIENYGLSLPAAFLHTKPYILRFLQRESVILRTLQTVNPPNMAADDENRSKDGRLTEELGVEFVCAVTQSLYRSRKSLREATFENCLHSGKRWLRRTLESAAVRQAIGASPQQWVDINQVFFIAISQLEVQSIPSDLNASSGATTSSALMAVNHDTLMKDLERLNDILLIARNCLATTQRAQNLAGESLLDQQVLKLIDLCVRVTARGYDGETHSRAEQPWANIIGACEWCECPHMQNKAHFWQIRSSSLLVSNFYITSS